MKEIKKFLTGAVLGISLVFTLAMNGQESCTICTESTISGNIQYSRLYNNTGNYYQCRVYNNIYDWKITVYPYTMSPWLVTGLPGAKWWYDCNPVG